VAARLVGEQLGGARALDAQDDEPRALVHHLEVNAFVQARVAREGGRHWHTKEDELVFILEGEVVLVTDRGEQTLVAGTYCAFPAGVQDGHHLINRSDQPARYLEISNRDPEDGAEYPDDDLHYAKTLGGGFVFSHKDRTPY